MATSTDQFTKLSSDLTELILSYLPVPSLLRASAVCKAWLALVSSHPHLLQRGPRRPWLFLRGVHNTSPRNHQTFAFDPASATWHRTPSPADPLLGAHVPHFSFSPAFRRNYQTAPLCFPRINPLVALHPVLLVVGGVRFIGNLVDIDEDRLASEIYHPRSDTWQLGPPLPAEFRSGNSSQTLSSALFRNRFYVLGIYSSAVASLDLRSRLWSEVRTIRPPGVTFSFIISCEDRLVLAGIREAPGGVSFLLWSVDEATMACTEITAMPTELLDGMFDGDEEDKFASLKCLGSGDLVYVFNEEYHRKYPACVCELGDGGASWRRVPSLPYTVNKFHKVISFCSRVSLDDVLGG